MNDNLNVYMYVCLKGVVWKLCNTTSDECNRRATHWRSFSGKFFKSAQSVALYSPFPFYR